MVLKWACVPSLPRIARNGSLAQFNGNSGCKNKIYWYHTVQFECNPVSDERQSNFEAKEWIRVISCSALHSALLCNIKEFYQNKADHCRGVKLYFKCKYQTIRGLKMGQDFRPLGQRSMGNPTLMT